MKQFQNFEEENIHYWTGRTDVAAMEAIARQTLLSEKQRPEWDLTVLRVAGMEAKADPEIWDGDGADYFVKKYIDTILQKDPDIDTLILGCTHYPLLLQKIRQYTPSHIRLVTQGEYVSESLKNYLSRHPDMDARCSKNKRREFLTTESVEKFRESASVFLHCTDVHVRNVQLE